jgi:hypothetical protein
MTGVAATVLSTAFATGVLGSAMATFEGAAGTSDSYPGVAGSGWQAGWVTTQGTGSPGSNGVGTLTNTTPLKSGSNNYVAFTNTPNPNFIPAAVSRQLNTTTKDYQQKFTLSFDLRLDSVGSSAGAFLFASNRYATNTASGAESAIMIDTSGGTSSVWQVSNGNRDTTFVYVNSTVAVTVGTTYSFVIDVDPTASKFDVKINGTDVNVNASTPQFTFRCADTNALQQSIFAFKSGGASTSFSLDNVSVVVPEPATLGTVGVLGIGLLARRKRHVA